MKTLYLLRHAKAGWGEPSHPDQDRSLLARGERDAAAMSLRWLERAVSPDLILSSSAVRALATARIVARGLNYEVNRIVVRDHLYGAPVGELISTVEGLDDDLDAVMLVGHNPGLADLARSFDGGITQMSTCTLAEFRFDTRSWGGLARVRPVSTVVDSPKASTP